MKKQKNTLGITRSSSRKKWIIALLLTLLVVVAIVFFLINTKKAATPSKKSEAAQTNSAKKNVSQSENTSDSQNAKNINNAPPQQTGSDSSPPSAQGTPSIEIASFSQSTTTVDTSAKLSNVTTAGVCVFSFTNKDDKPVIQQVNSDGKTCSSSISSVEFSKLGIWALNIAFYKGSTKVLEVNGNVTIN